MEKARWKIRFCLLAVVLAAITIGCIYYWQELRPAKMSQGILITMMGDVEGNGSE